MKETKVLNDKRGDIEIPRSENSFMRNESKGTPNPFFISDYVPNLDGKILSLKY